MDKKWWQSSVVYQIYPRSFQDSNGDGIGDIPGITSRLEYLAELGVDVIWLSPVYASPNDDNGYDISDYQAIMPEFGTMADFDEMLAKAHGLGLKIVMDLVVNHTSDEHRWFQEARKSRDNPYRDYYIWRDPKVAGRLEGAASAAEAAGDTGIAAKERPEGAASAAEAAGDAGIAADPAAGGSEPNNWGSCFGGSAWEFDEATGQYYLHLFSKKQPDLNWDNPKVRDEVYAMMKWWLDKGVDGFRMDVISLISKPEGLPDGPAAGSGYASFDLCATGPHLHEYLREMNRRVLSQYDIITVGECPGVPMEEAREYANLEGTELNMVFQFEHMSCDHDPRAGRYGISKLDLPALKGAMAKWETGLEGRAWNSLYWDNHDQPRAVSRFGNDSDAYRELSAKMLGTCLHLMQGTPYIFEGEELGMTNCPWDGLDEIDDIESRGNVLQNVANGLVKEEQIVEIMRRQSRDNARTPMQWDASENAGFTTGTPWLRVNPNYENVNAAEQVGRPDSVFRYYQKLIALRKSSDLIVLGNFELLEPESDEVFVYTRTLGERKLLVACNFTNHEVRVEVPEGFACGEKVIGNYDGLIETGTLLRAYEAYAVQIGN